jgi:hypothetical protein
MLVPVWSADWELECCQPEAEVGHEWVVPIALTLGPDPWWVADFAATATDEQRALGRVVLDAATVDPAESAGGSDVMMSGGPFRFRAMSGTPEGRLEGRLYVDAHPTDQGVSARDVAIRGVVERVELVPLRYRREAKTGTFVPASQLETISVESTRARDAYRSDATGDATELVRAELLVWLRVDLPTGRDESRPVPSS